VFRDILAKIDLKGQRQVTRTIRPDEVRDLEHSVLGRPVRAQGQGESGEGRHPLSGLEFPKLFFEVDDQVGHGDPPCPVQETGAPGSSRGSTARPQALLL
jgi:hypothetical protein